MAAIDHIRVPRTRSISAPAKRLFFRPNCIGVKEKLKIRLRTKGNTTIKDNPPFKAVIKTLPKEIAIKM